MEKYCSGPQTSATHPRTDWTEMLNKRGCLQWEIRKEDRREKGHTLILVTGTWIAISLFFRLMI